MRFAPHQDEYAQARSPQAGCAEAPVPRDIVGGGCGASVCVTAIDIASASNSELRERVGLIGRAESTLAAFKSEALAELAQRDGLGAAKRIARDVLRSSPSRAHRDVKAAERLAELAATSEALASGQVPADHAQLIARASSEGPIDEAELVEAAKTQTYDELAKTVKRQQHELSGDDGQAIFDRQKQKRTARMFQNAETGMYVLNAEFDPVTGAHLAGALAHKERELWRAEDPKARRSPHQRSADAL
ncbi:MAG: DUF222 domain-containing protein, partial [bacterium]|nr:DUF222 domain-containing protein [bacterium]